LHPPQKLQRPEINPLCVTSLCAHDDDFHHPQAKTFGLASFLAKKKKDG
jgi:hypothetical protein